MRLKLFRKMDMLTSLLHFDQNLITGNLTQWIVNYGSLRHSESVNTYFQEWGVARRRHLRRRAERTMGYRP